MLSTFYLASILFMWLKSTYVNVRSQKRVSGNHPLVCNPINQRTYTQIHTPTVAIGSGGGRERIWWNPFGFDMLQYFETVLPSVESLWSPLQDEVYFMSGCAGGGLRRNQTWLPSWILSKVRNQVKTVWINNFFCA